MSALVEAAPWTCQNPGVAFSETPILVTQAARTNSLGSMSSHVNGGYWLATILFMFIIIIILPPKFYLSKLIYWQLWPFGWGSAL